MEEKKEEDTNSKKGEKENRTIEKSQTAGRSTRAMELSRIRDR